MSTNSLLDNVVLAAKNHYRPPTDHPITRAEIALMIFREWTGTNASKYKDVLSVVLPMALRLKHFKHLSEERMATFMLQLINGQGHFDYDPQEDRHLRAVRVLMGELAMTHRDNWLDGREVPKPDPTIQRLFLNLNRTQPA